MTVNQHQNRQQRIIIDIIRSSRDLAKPLGEPGTLLRVLADAELHRQPSQEVREEVHDLFRTEGNDDPPLVSRLATSLWRHSRRGHSADDDNDEAVVVHSALAESARCHPLSFESTASIRATLRTPFFLLCAR